MNQPPQSRPTSSQCFPSAVIICVSLLIGGGAVITFASVLDEQTVRENPIWYSPLATISSILGLVVATGLVMMRFWAVLLYGVIVAVYHGIMFSYGARDVVIFLFHSIILTILFSHRSKMKPLGWADSITNQEPEQSGRGDGDKPSN